MAVDYRDWAEKLIETLRTESGVVGYQGSMLVWEGGCYRRLSQQEVHLKAVTWMSNTKPPKRVSPPRISQLSETAILLLMNDGPRAANTWIKPANSDEHSCRWIAFRNGVLNLSAFIQGRIDLVPPSPRFFSESVLPYDFVPDAECSQWEECLHEWMDDDEERIALLQEFVGSCLVPDTSWQTGLFLEGKGANGKSVFCGAVTDMLGRANVSNVGLSEFGKRFGMARTLGKLVNISTETPSRVLVQTDLLNSFISGESMRFERKFQEPIDAVPTAKLILAWNNRPRVDDASDGFWRRMRLVPFRRTYLPHEQDAFLPMKLRSELPGIFLWAATGLRRLITTNRFTSSSESVASTQEFARDAAPLRAFLDDTYVADPLGFLPNETIRRDYLAWCSEHHEEVQSDKLLFQTLRQCFPRSLRFRPLVGTLQVRGIKGISPKAPQQVEAHAQGQGNYHSVPVVRLDCPTGLLN